MYGRQLAENRLRKSFFIYRGRRRKRSWQALHELEGEVNVVFYLRQNGFISCREEGH
jgi:hypothetical protein